MESVFLGRKRQVTFLTVAHETAAPMLGKKAPNLFDMEIHDMEIHVRDSWQMGYIVLLSNFVLARLEPRRASC